MRIAVSGGTGLIGTHFIDFYLKKQAEIVLITRKLPNRKYPKNIHTVTWSDLKKQPEVLEGADAVVNLAGETINQRWTTSAKKRILQSRIEATQRIAEAVMQLHQPPKAVINGSAVGIYGHEPLREFDETDTAVHRDFLTEVVEAWEAESRKIEVPRVVQLRIGIVLSNKGGAFQKILLPHKLGMGGNIGSGRQWMSWIHIEDLVRIIDTCIREENMRGPVNCVAPEAATNQEFGRTLAQVWNRPYFLHIPAPVFKVLFGEMSDLLIKGQKVVPAKLKQNGFVFHYPSLKKAFEDLLHSRH